MNFYHETLAYQNYYVFCNNKLWFKDWNEKYIRPSGSLLQATIAHEISENHIYISDGVFIELGKPLQSTSIYFNQPNTNEPTQKFLFSFEASFSHFIIQDGFILTNEANHLKPAKYTVSKVLVLICDEGIVSMKLDSPNVLTLESTRSDLKTVIPQNLNELGYYSRVNLGNSRRLILTENDELLVITLTALNELDISVDFTISESVKAVAYSIFTDMLVVFDETGENTFTKIYDLSHNITNLSTTSVLLPLNSEAVISEKVTKVMFLNANLLIAIGASGKVYYSMANGYDSFKEVSLDNSVSLPYKEIFYPDDDLSILFLDQNDKIFYWRYPFPDMIDTGILWNPNCILSSLTLFDSRPKYFCSAADEIWIQDNEFSQANLDSKATYPDCEYEMNFHVDDTKSSNIRELSINKKRPYSIKTSVTGNKGKGFMNYQNYFLSSRKGDLKQIFHKNNFAEKKKAGISYSTTYLKTEAREKLIKPVYSQVFKIEKASPACVPRIFRFTLRDNLQLKFNYSASSILAISTGFHNDLIQESRLIQLKTNYRPPSYLGKEHHLSKNVYNVDIEQLQTKPLEPPSELRTMYRNIQILDHDFNACKNAESTTACNCEQVKPLETLSTSRFHYFNDTFDPDSTNCIKYMVNFKKIFIPYPH